jgi:predicted glycoside hydrolase/deacetylase ChbG (UPF0249 family)
MTTQLDPSTNPVLKKLGLGPRDRAVIVHTDDIGMCQASVSAFVALWEAGRVSSAVTMTPCPWFRLLADYCRAHPDVDMGVHITLTSEWEHYRWGPLSTRDPAAGLLDEQGYFPRGNAPIHAHARLEDVQREMQAQVEHALAAGIAPTHIDTHMGTVMHPRLLGAYLQLGVRYHVPVMMPRMDAAALQAQGISSDDAAVLAQMWQGLEADGLPLIDNVSGMPLDVEGEHADHFAVAQRTFAALPAGITHFVLHPSTDTPELRALAPDWRGRVANLETFMRADLLPLLRQMGIHVIGYRALKDLIRT